MAHYRASIDTHRVPEEALARYSSATGPRGRAIASAPTSPRGRQLARPARLLLIYGPFSRG